ncbi:hypothetical protein L3X37_12170 [Sabulilitoribacter arenilitoris]|uniref:Lipoprotein n=1 Tax=Wocania arenilitoris TaxID=2044858 RepID=A0AAE3ERS9_9FLAO|nr:hypothetical protein [Wocania arenilitoris]MCF7569114.1 hypothetical protein [Wocania arenilitoris]
MRKLSFLFFSAIIVLVSCDGRDRKHKTNAEILKENKLFESFSEQIQYIPEEQTEIFIDTVLSTGFQIKLHYYSIAGDYSTKIKATSDKANKTFYFKNFEAQYSVSKNKSLITQQVISKNLFSAYGSPDFWKKAVMQFVWVDYENSTEDFITLNTSFNIPETDIYKDFRIIVNTLGNIKIQQVNLVESVM